MTTLDVLIWAACLAGAAVVLVRTFYKEPVVYEEEVRVTRKVSALAGPGEERTTLTELRQDGGILAAFADDDDIQEITVCSTNLGMVRVYRKAFKD